MGFKSYPRVYFEIMSAGFALSMSNSLQAAFLPIFASDLDPSGALVGFAVAAWFLPSIFMELPLGVFSDSLGKRKLLVGGLALAAGGAFLCSVVDSIYILIIGRVFWGLGSGLFFLSSTALVLDLFEPSIRGRSLGTLQGIENIGHFMGAPVGGFMAGIMGYRSVFFLALVLTLCSFSVAFTSKGLRQKGTEMSGGPKSSVREVFSSLWSWGLTVIYIIAFSRLLIMRGVMGTVFPLYLNRQLGISVGLIGVVVSLRTAGHVIAVVTAGYLSDVSGRKLMIVAGILMQGGCLYLYTLLSSFDLLLLVGFFEGLGEGMVLSSLIVLLSEIAPARLRGGAIGMYRTCLNMGGFLGPLFFMLLFSSVGAYNITFLSAVAILALNIVLMMTIKSKRTTE